MADENDSTGTPPSNGLMPFEFEGAAVRVIDRDSGPWFVLTDICTVLEIANPRDAASRLDDDEKGVGNTDTPGGSQEVTIINESGLYSLILTSRKPAAKRFKKWVTAEVLPAIRKTGGYGDFTTLSEDEAAMVNNARQVPRATRGMIRCLLALEMTRAAGKPAPALDLMHDGALLRRVYGECAQRLSAVRFRRPPVAEMAKKLRLDAAEVRRALELLAAGGALEFDNVGQYRLRELPADLAALVPPPAAPALPPPPNEPPPEEPRCCKGCYAKEMWREEGRSLLHDEPLTKAELSVVAAARLLILDEVNRRIRDRANAVIAALGLPDPDPVANLPAKRKAKTDA